LQDDKEYDIGKNVIGIVIHNADDKIASQGWIFRKRVDGNSPSPKKRMTLRMV
jgi:hypothetical protein